MRANKEHLLPLLIGNWYKNVHHVQPECKWYKILWILLGALWGQLKRQRIQMNTLRQNTHGRYKARDSSVVNKTVSWVAICNASVGSSIYSQGIGKTMWHMTKSRKRVQGRLYNECWYHFRAHNYSNCKNCILRRLAAKIQNLARSSELVPKNPEDELWLNSLRSL